jgi:predicted tellurium resistance membrane protein TerC
LAFSIDNVFAAVAFTDHVFLIYTGVFIGILAMRFVAQAFVKLMEKFTFLETVAFMVIGVLGIKLTASLFVHFYPESAVSKFMEGETADIAVSYLPYRCSLSRCLHPSFSISLKRTSLNPK